MRQIVSIFYFIHYHHQAQIQYYTLDFLNECLYFIKSGPSEGSAAASGMWRPRNNTDLGSRLPIQVIYQQQQVKQSTASWSFV